MERVSLKPIRFGDYLVERSAITEEQLLDALAAHWATGCKIGEAVSHRGYLSASEVERFANEFASLQTIYV